MTFDLSSYYTLLTLNLTESDTFVHVIRERPGESSDLLVQLCIISWILTMCAVMVIYAFPEWSLEGPKNPAFHLAGRRN